MFKKNTQKYIVMKHFQDHHSEWFLIKDFVKEWRFFRNAPFVWYSATTIIPKLKKEWYLMVVWFQKPMKIFSSIHKPMSVYSITPKGLNLKLWK